MDLGWLAVRIRRDVLHGGNSRPGVTNWGREVMVKVYGVAMTMPQGQSRVPHPSTGTQ